jgi:Trehalose utilisation
MAAMNVLVLGALSVALAAPPPVRLLVVTGGHDYPTSFYTVFEQDGLTWDHALSNEEAFRKDLRGRYDALVLYDSSATISPEGQAHFHEFVEAGGGVVVLHHAIVSYQDSDWYRDLVGGRSQTRARPPRRLAAHHRLARQLLPIAEARPPAYRMFSKPRELDGYIAGLTPGRKTATTPPPDARVTVSA